MAGRKKSGVSKNEGRVGSRRPFVPPRRLACVELRARGSPLPFVQARFCRLRARGLPRAVFSPVSCPESPRFPPWGRESYRTPVSRTKGSCSSTDDGRLRGPRPPPGQDPGSTSRSRIALPPIHERKIGQKSFAYRPALDTRMIRGSKNARATPARGRFALKALLNE